VLIRVPLAAALLSAVVLLVPGLAFPGEEELPDLSAERLADPELIAHGQEVFEHQCTLCHGRSAYPGKAPMLQPRRYTAEFVYDRVTNGFRDMPAWGDMYSEEDRVAIVAWIMSDRFSH
jgi:mono/diheme cytochrome c family protein